MQKSVQARKNRIISAMSGQFQSGLPIFKTNRNTNRDWLSGGENLPEILLGYHQYHDGDNEYSYRDLFR